VVAAKRAPEPPNTRLSIGDYIADILLDARPEGTIYHWIVQRVGSATIVHWGQEYTFERRSRHRERLSGKTFAQGQNETGLGLCLYCYGARALLVQFIQINTEILMIQAFADGPNELEFHLVSTFGTTREDLILEEGNFMGQAMGLMDNAVNPAFSNRLACSEDGLFPHTARCRFYQNQSRLLGPH
jgi:hypothetical protein